MGFNYFQVFCGVFVLLILTFRIDVYLNVFIFNDILRYSLPAFIPAQVDLCIHMCVHTLYKSYVIYVNVIMLYCWVTLTGWLDLRWRQVNFSFILNATGRIITRLSRFDVFNTFCFFIIAITCHLYVCSMCYISRSIEAKICLVYARPD